MKKVLLILCAFMLSCQNIAFAQTDTQIYVSPDGDDSAQGTIDAPLKTVEKAYQTALQSKGDKISLYFMDGEYFVDNTIEMNSSNLNNKGIEFLAYENAEPVFNGGTVIEGWVDAGNGLWKASVGDDVFFRTLYINGVKGIRGRYPDIDNYLALGGKTDKGLYVDKDAVSGIKGYENRLEIGINYEWMTKFFRVSEFVETEEKFEAIINETEWKALKSVPQGAHIASGAKYWYENALEFVDSPGEWYLDENANIVYYCPYSHQTPENTVISYGRLENIITLNGTTENHIKNVRIDGITFTGTDWTYPSKAGFVDVQANSIAPADLAANKDSQYRLNLKKQKLSGAIHAYYCDDIVIENCHFEGISANAVVFQEGGKNITVTKNTFVDIGSTAIEIGSDYYRARNTDMYHVNVDINNNFIENVANYYYGGVGILAYYVDGMNISHNHIKNSSYSAISVNWGWGLGDVVEQARNYKICNNRVENFMSRLRDGGGIYTPCVMNGENIIEGNYIIGNAVSYDPKSGSSAIYHDGASKNWIDRKNVIEDITNPFSLQSVKGQEASNITMINNYTNSPITYASELKNIVEEENVLFNSNLWNGEALEIIENAGLEDDNVMKEVPQASVDRNFYEKIVPGQEMNFVLTVRNMQNATELNIDVDVPENAVYIGEKTISVSEHEVVDVNIPIKTDISIPEGFYRVPVRVYGGDKLIAITYCAFLVEDKYNIIIDINDVGCTKTGEFAYSGLQGYSSSSEYGYGEKGAAIMYVPSIPAAGEYTVKIWIMKHATSDSNSLIEVKHADGVYKTNLNFQELDNGWYEIGTFRFDDYGYLKNTWSQRDGTFLRASAASFSRSCTDEEKLIMAEENHITKLSSELVFLNGKDYCFVNGFKQKLAKPFDIDDDSSVTITPQVLARLIGGITVKKGNEVDVIKGCVGYRFIAGNNYYEVNSRKVYIADIIDDSFTVPAKEILESFGYFIRNYDNGITTVSAYDTELNENLLTEGFNAFVE